MSSTAQYGRRGSTVQQLSVTVLLLAVAGYFLLPVWWLIVSATKSNGDLFGSNGFWFGSSLHLAGNLTKVFEHSDGVFARWILNSALYSGVVPRWPPCWPRWRAMRWRSTHSGGRR